MVTSLLQLQWDELGEVCLVVCRLLCGTGHNFCVPNPLSWLDEKPWFSEESEADLSVQAAVQNPHWLLAAGCKLPIPSWTETRPVPSATCHLQRRWPLSTAVTAPILKSRWHQLKNELASLLCTAVCNEMQLTYICRSRGIPHSPLGLFSVPVCKTAALWNLHFLQTPHLFSILRKRRGLPALFCADS